MEQLGEGIAALRGLISELRPAALDELGLAAGDRGAGRAAGGTRASWRSRPRSRSSRAPTGAAERLEPELESTALPGGPGGAHQRRQARSRRAGAARRCARPTAGSRSSSATTAAASTPSSPTDGFGLMGMRERVELAGRRARRALTPGGGDRDPRRAFRRRRAQAGLEQVALERVADELRALGHPQLLLDVGAVRLDRADAEVELVGDLAVGVAERDQPQDLDLALGEVVRRARAARPRAARPARAGGRSCPRRPAAPPSPAPRRRRP